MENFLFATQIFYVEMFNLVWQYTASQFARIRRARDFLTREGIFPFDGINMPEFQRERDAWGYLLEYTKLKRREIYISCNGINDLTELRANVLSLPNIHNDCVITWNNSHVQKILMQNLMRHFIHTSIYRNNFCTCIFFYMRNVEQERKCNIQSTNTVIFFGKSLNFVNTSNITSKFLFN